MAITNHERVGKALDLLRVGLAPFVDREVEAALRAGRIARDSLHRFLDDPQIGKKPIAAWDASGLLRLMWDLWNDVFRQTLGFGERSLVGELREWRTKWAHQAAFSSRDAERALDSMARLLTAISAPQADEIDRMMLELRRITFEEQVRGEKRKAGGSPIEAAVAGSLKPWREVVTPHPDVASGRYQQSEFAADLWQVHLGEGSDEYRDPVEFFRRTCLTDSLKRLLIGAVRRLSGRGGDPVVHLQTTFGGGKTHSMLALYHLFSGVSPVALIGAEHVFMSVGVSQAPSVRRVTLVGNKISPGNPVVKPDGTVVRTLWGELAWQLGGANAYARIAQDDEHATNPGDRLRILFNEYAPCLILIDEWVAYARQLHDRADLPGGSFETQFTFAQALTESAKLADRCLLVISLPASDTQADDVEIGGLRGREALDRLRNVVGRVESSWRPASAEEEVEIVRRRLFQTITDPEAFKQRDVTARAFADFYRAHAADFPPECRTRAYEQRIKAAYPIHPEMFDRLYTDWSTLLTFQRTRGVLRLMAAVIHSLWKSGDRNPLILPATIPIDDARVQFELTRYLSDNWAPIIEKDVDGPNSLPLKIDGEQSNLGKVSAARRVARTIFLGSAPTAATANHGLEDRRIKLGCVMPGESPAAFGDALRRLAATATYLYQDDARYWYATQPTVTRLAEDRAEQLKHNGDAVIMEAEARLRAALRDRDGFRRIHPLPRSAADVPDDRDARLVVLSPEHPYRKGLNGASPAELFVRRLLESRGTTPRRHRNALVFLAPDATKWQDLEEGIRQFLAWQSILDEKDALNVTPHQIRQAETQRRVAESTVLARLQETYEWLLVPHQESPQSPPTIDITRLSGNESLVARVVKRLRSADALAPALGATELRRYLDGIPLWRGNHVSVRQLVEDFATYLYLPRLTDSDVLVRAIEEGVALPTWADETFAYAEGYDEATGRYQGLRGGQSASITADSAGLLVKPDVALQQMRAPSSVSTTGGSSRTAYHPETPCDPITTDAAPPMPTPTAPSDRSSRRLRRFHGVAPLSPERAGRDAARIAEEVIVHLIAIGANVKVTLDIDADLPDDAGDWLMRTVGENCRHLGFAEFEFESDPPPRGRAPR